MSWEMVAVQCKFGELGGRSLGVDWWMQGLILKLLETAHRQWLYQNVQVHDVVTDALAMARKEELQ